MIDLQHEVADVQACQDFTDYRDYLRIRKHRAICTSDVKVALVELTVPALRHLRLVTAVDFSNVEALNRRQRFFSHVPGEWHCQVVSQGQDLAALVLKVVYKLAVFSVLASEGLFQLKDRRINFTSSMFLKNSSDRLEGLVSDRHLQRCHVSGSLRTLGSASLLIVDLKNV